MSRSAWKAVLSEAVLTGGEALGMSMLNGCLEGSTSSSVQIQQSTVFQTVVLFPVAQDCVLGYDRFAKYSLPGWSLHT